MTDLYTGKFNPADFKVAPLSLEDLQILIQEEKRLLIEKEKLLEEQKLLLGKTEEEVMLYRNKVLKSSALLKEELRKKEYVVNECICGHCGAPRYVRKVESDFLPKTEHQVHSEPMEFTDSELLSSGINPELVTKSILTFSTCSGCSGYEK